MDVARCDIARYEVFVRKIQEWSTDLTTVDRFLVGPTERPSIPRSCSLEQALAMGEHCYVLRDFGGVSTWTQYRCKPALGVPWNRLRDAGVERA